MNTSNSRTEIILATHHAALVDVAAGVGVGLLCAPENLTLEALEDWWASRHLLDVELRILGLAVVELLPGGRYVIGPCPWGPEDWEDVVPLDGGPAVPLWTEGETPVYSAGRLEVDGHPALPRLWEELDGVLELA